MKKYFIEGLGTFFLVFFGCGCSVISFERIGSLGVALTFGIIYYLWYCIAHSFSVCHLNPTFTFGSFLTNALDFKTFLKYFLTQLIGSLVASIFLFLLFLLTSQGGSFIADSQWAVGYASFSIMSSSGIWAFILECIVTVVLVLVFMISNFGKTKSAHAGLIVALAYTLAVLVTFTFTGSCVNPARGFGPAFLYLTMGTYIHFIQFIILMISNFLGAFFAFVIYYNLYKEDCIS